MFDFNENNDYEKRVIGKLIYYYRHNRKIKLEKMLYNKGSYYEKYCVSCNKCKKIEIICSAGTLYKIEAGKMIVKNDCIYHRLCENIDKTFVFDDKVYARLRKYQSLLYDNLVHFSKKNLTNLESNIEQDLNKYENCIYVYELLLLYSNIINYILYKKLPCKNVSSLYLYLKEFVCLIDKKLILFFLFHMSNEFISKEFDRKDIITMCIDYFDDELFYEIKLSSIVDNNFLDAYAMLEEEEKRDDLSQFQKFNIIKFKAFVLLNSGSFEKCYLSLIMCLEILEKTSNYSDVELYNCYRRLGIVCYILQRYDESIQFYKKVIDANLSLGINYCLLFYSLELNSRNDEIINILSKMNFSNIMGNINEKVVLDYYREKYLHGEINKERMRILERYICDRVKPIFSMIGSMQKNVFISDLKYYVKYTGDYKYLYEVLECDNSV